MGLSITLWLSGTKPVAVEERENSWDRTSAQGSGARVAACLSVLEGRCWGAARGRGKGARGFSALWRKVFRVIYSEELRTQRRLLRLTYHIIVGTF